MSFTGNDPRISLMSRISRRACLWRDVESALSGREPPGGRCPQHTPSRREGVARDVERAGDLAINTREHAGEIEPVGFQFIEVARVIEIEIHHGTIMFPRRDQDRGFTAPEKV